MNGSVVVALALLLPVACTDLAGPPRRPVVSDDTPAGSSTSAAAPDRCSGTAAARVEGELRRVRLIVEPCHVSTDRAPRMTLANVGDKVVGYGPGFKLERRTEGEWVWVNRRQGFNLPLFYVEPGRRGRPEPIAVYFQSPVPVRLRPGLYRVSKTVQLTPGRPRPPTMEVAATFHVVE